LILVQKLKMCRIRLYFGDGRDTLEHAAQTDNLVLAVDSDRAAAEVFLDVRVHAREEGWYCYEGHGGGGDYGRGLDKVGSVRFGSGGNGGGGRLVG
jgi:uncharacterized membrane protein YgcG